jgi:glutamine---fructose-6-phosphate transaminase (isomerizing)
MCGIFGVIGSKQHAGTRVLDGLKLLEYRGYDSWGVAMSDDLTHAVTVIKKAGKIGEAQIPKQTHCTLALGHTRWATHGGVTQENAHPHLDCTQTTVVVHNGIISNWETLKKHLLKQGHKFLSETDTEVIPHLIEQYRYTMSFEDAVRQTFLDAEGMNAFVCFDSAERKIIAIKNGSPLIVGFGKNEALVASDQYALSQHTDDIHVLKDNEYAILTDTSIKIKNVQTRDSIKPRITHPPVIRTSTGVSTYTHMMEREIYEQTEVLTHIATQPILHEKTLKDALNATHIVMTGCGTAYHAALTGSYVFADICRRSVTAVIAPEMEKRIPDMNQDAHVIALSQSGETMDTLTAVKWAKRKNALVTALVNVEHSAIWDEADYPILLGAGPERAVASTKAFTAKLAWLTRLAYFCIGKPETGIQAVLDASLSVADVLSPNSRKLIHDIAVGIHTHDHCFVIGHNRLYPIALETALKIKEVSYIHAEGMASSELKHGTLALIEQGTPCIVLSDSETDTISQTAASEIKARGAYVIGIGISKFSTCDAFIPIKNTEELTMIPIAVVGQLLGYDLAVLRGFDPDKPRNLAKSVTVG